MSPKTFAALAVATVVAVAAATVAVTRDRGFTPAAGAGEPVVPGLLERVNDVAKAVVLSGDTITIEHGKDGWTVKENDDYPARAVSVRQPSWRSPSSSSWSRRPAARTTSPSSSSGTRPSRTRARNG